MKRRLDRLRKSELIRLVEMYAVRGSLVSLFLQVGPAMAMFMFLGMVLKEEEMKPENIFSSIAILNVVKLPFMSFGFLIACFTTIKVSMKRINDFLMLPELKATTPNVDKYSEYAVEMKDVEYKFPNGDVAFSCEDLKIKKGELVCVLGSVGSGKSSFILSILNELEKTKGESYINGKITYGSQTAWLMNTTLKENIIFLENYNKKKYQECIYNACLTRDIQILKGGDMYEIAERGSNLSGGQRQRISIGRVLYNAKDIVIFDDPLSAVDFEVGSFIFENAIQN